VSEPVSEQGLLGKLVQKTEVPDPTLPNRDVIIDLDKLARKFLHKDPLKRLHSAREMGDELMAYLFQITWHSFLVTSNLS